MALLYILISQYGTQHDVKVQCMHRALMCWLSLSCACFCCCSGEVLESLATGDEFTALTIAPGVQLNAQQQHSQQAQLWQLDLVDLTIACELAAVLLPAAMLCAIVPLQSSQSMPALGCCTSRLSRMHGLRHHAVTLQP
jgi:hypothetical protein